MELIEPTFNMLVKRTLKKEHPFFRKDLVWYS